MMTLPEFLRFEIDPGDTLRLVLRSGQIIVGELEDIDLTAYVVRLDGWRVHISEITGAKIDVQVPAEV